MPDTNEPLDISTPEGYVEFRKQVHKSFEAFPGATYDEVAGTITLDPESQAQIIMSIHELRTRFSQLVNVLGALKYTVKAQVEKPPMELRKALYVADELVADPVSVDLSYVPDLPTGINDLKGWDA